MASDFLHRALKLKVHISEILPTIDPKTIAILDHTSSGIFVSSMSNHFTWVMSIASLTEPKFCFEICKALLRVHITISYRVSHSPERIVWTWGNLGAFQTEIAPNLHYMILIPFWVQIWHTTQCNFSAVLNDKQYWKRSCRHSNIWTAHSFSCVRSIEKIEKVVCTLQYIDFCFIR